MNKNTVCCPVCQSTKVVKDGKTRQEKSRFKCKNKLCSHYINTKRRKRFVERQQQNVLEAWNRVPKILLLDTEVSPKEGFFWNVWNTNINSVFLKHDSNIICWSAKFLFDSKMHHDCQTAKEAENRDDKRIVKSLYDLMNEADVIVAHNLDKYDYPIIKTRGLIHGFQPLKSLLGIDTLKQVKKEFKFTWNSLNWISSVLNKEEKLKTDYSLWLKVLEGDKKSLNYMQEYCDKDVLILEDTYLKIRPYIKGHPNLNLMTEAFDGHNCTNCGSKAELTNEDYFTPSGVFQSYKCTVCGKRSRGRINQLNKKQKEYLLVPSAK